MIIIIQKNNPAQVLLWVPTEVNPILVTLNWHETSMQPFDISKEAQKAQA
jgi:hypothetical protein